MIIIYLFKCGVNIDSDTLRDVLRLSCEKKTFKIIENVYYNMDSIITTSKDNKIVCNI